VSAPSARLVSVPELREGLRRSAARQGPWALGLLAAFTLVALALRAAGAGQSLFGDELFLYDIVRREDLWSVLERVHDTESTPPLHFVLAWAAAKVGEPTVSVRLPSLILGTATVPIVYALGVRTVGVRAALAAGAITALSPFAIFYSIEARAYATLGFLSALSTLSLLVALERRRPLAWLGFGLVTAVMLYTHYAAVFVVAAQGLWALVARRDQWRSVVAVYAGVAVAYAPWIPSYLVQRVDSAAVRIQALYPLDAESAVRALIELFAGWPPVPLRDVPGQAAVAVLCVGLVGAAIASVVDRGRARLRSPVTLLVVLALATPVGALIYSLGPTSVYVPRNLIPSMPGLFLLTGLLVTRPAWPWRAILLLLVLGPLLFGALRTLDDEVRRPPLRDAAERIDDRARAGDVVAYRPLFPLERPSALRRDLEVHLERPHRFVAVDRRPRLAWELAQHGQRVYSVGLEREGFPGPAKPPRDLSSAYRLRERRIYAGAQPIAVLVYERTQGR
jgi:mannosyltransferase